MITYILCVLSFLAGYLVAAMLIIGAKSDNQRLLEKYHNDNHP